MENNWLETVKTNQLSTIIATNSYTEKYGLTLSNEEAQLILTGKNESLIQQRRVELGGTIVEKLIKEFCDSEYISQKNYVDTILRLQDIFYLYKNEMMDEITDDELLHLMKDQFETICFGDLDYLEGTSLNNFAEAVRAGYGDYHYSDGYGEAERFEMVKRWDYDLYMDTLNELCGR